MFQHGSRHTVRASSFGGIQTPKKALDLLHSTEKFSRAFVCGIWVLVMLRERRMTGVKTSREKCIKHVGLAHVLTGAHTIV